VASSYAHGPCRVPLNKGSEKTSREPYYALGAFHLEGSLDLDVLRRCFEALVERHEILRPTYVVVDGRPMQMIGSVPPVDLNVVDLRDRRPDEREAEVQKVLKAESRFAFDLARALDEAMSVADARHRSQAVNGMGVAHPVVATKGAGIPQSATSNGAGIATAVEATIATETANPTGP